MPNDMGWSVRPLLHDLRFKNERRRGYSRVCVLFIAQIYIYIYIFYISLCYIIQKAPYNVVPYTYAFVRGRFKQLTSKMPCLLYTVLFQKRHSVTCLGRRSIDMPSNIDVPMRFFEVCVTIVWYSFVSRL